MNLWQHLEESHIEEYRQVKEAKQTSESESSSSINSTQEASHNQPTINEVLSQKQPYPQNSARLKTLNDSVCYFISKDMHPYQTVNDPGFQVIFGAFDLQYIPMDRKTPVTNYILKFYDREKE